MLQHLGPRSSLFGSVTAHECPKCRQEVELPFGDLCADCKATIEQKARKISRIVAAGSTLVLAVYVYVRMPDDSTSRFVGLASVAAWYIVTGLVTRRIVREALK